MKKLTEFSTALLIVAAVAFVGCGKEESVPQPAAKPASGLQKAVEGAADKAQKAATDAKTSAEKAAVDAKAGVEKAASEAGAAAHKAVSDVTKAAGDAVKAAGEKVGGAVDAAKHAVPNATSAVSAEAQKVIDQARGFVAEKKYAEALAALKGLARGQLSPEQSSLVEALKAQIQKLMATPAVADPAKAIGNLPGVPKP
jgi:ElaB/YqjD/DUF883 family membrane-anchored ribosome-binding protein